MVLNFTQEGSFYVSDPIENVNSCSVHINTDENAQIEVFRSMDAENLGWSQVASRESHGNYEETIAGIPEGVAVRIRIDVEPTDAEYIVA